MHEKLGGEIELLKGMIAGDTESFRQIYGFYQGRVFLFAFRLTKSKSDAEEVVQEVFVKLWEKRENINIDKSFSAYVLTITKNFILDKFKKASLDRAMQQKMYANMQAMQNASVDEIIKKELHRLQMQAINKLSPQQKKMFLLSREEELTYEEIANKLGISKNTVRNQISDALRTIRDYLSNHPDITHIITASLLTSAIFS